MASSSASPSAITGLNVMAITSCSARPSASPPIGKPLYERPPPGVIFRALVRRSTMTKCLFGLAAVVLVAGCGTTSTQVSSSTAQERHTSSAGSTTLISDARADLAAHTHHGADSISGLRVAGRCSGSTVVVLLGHAAPFERLRKTGNAAIDRTKPQRRAILRTACSKGRFVLKKQQLAVRWGSGPLRAWPAGERSAAVKVAVKSIAME